MRRLPGDCPIQMPIALWNILPPSWMWQWLIFVATGLLGGLIANAGLAKLHAARAEVGEFALHDAVRLAAARQFQAVVAEVRKPAILEDTVTDTLAPDRAGHAHGRLAETADLGFRRGRDTRLVLAAVEARRETPFGVRKGEAAQDDMLDELPGFGPAFDANHL